MGSFMLVHFFFNIIPYHISPATYTHIPRFCFSAFFYVSAEKVSNIILIVDTMLKCVAFISSWFNVYSLFYDNYVYQHHDLFPLKTINYFSFSFNSMNFYSIFNEKKMLTKSLIRY